MDLEDMSLTNSHITGIITWMGRVIVDAPLHKSCSIAEKIFDFAGTSLTGLVCIYIYTYENNKLASSKMRKLKSLQAEKMTR